MNQRYSNASLYAANSSFPRIPSDLISRDAEIESIIRYLIIHDVVVISGSRGMGKTTLLSEFCMHHPFNSISYFVSAADRFSYSPLSVKQCLYEQIFLYTSKDNISHYNNEFIHLIDDNNFSNKMNVELRKRMRKEKDVLYFVFDGLCEIESADFQVLHTILAALPYGYAKFIFSGDATKIESFLQSTLKIKELPINPFGFNQTKEFFKNIDFSDQEISEIHKICNKGLPEKLVVAKRLCEEFGGIKNFLAKDITDKTDLFDIEWKELPEGDDILINILTAVAFDESATTLNKLSYLLELSEQIIQQKISTILILENEDDKISFVSTSHREYAQKKLAPQKSELVLRLITYYEENPQDSESMFNLPRLYNRAQKWRELASFLSVQTFVKMIELQQSIAGIKRQVDFGLEASSRNQDFLNISSDIFRFSLHKSTFRELERQRSNEEEIEAYFSLGEFEKAFTLANSAFLKEERLLLLAKLAKKRKERMMQDDQVIIGLIREIYPQIDFSNFQNMGLRIAGYLVYSCLDLSLALVEQLSANPNSETTRDSALAFLSLQAIRATKKGALETDGINMISAQIQDESLKNLASGFTFLSGELGAAEIIQYASKVSDNKQKIILLKNWIKNNQERDDVGVAIESALNEIIRGSLDNIPNATTMSEIASALPNIKSSQQIKSMIALFDSQKKAINTPTRDYITLQLSIAEALSKFDIDSTKDRIFETLYLIEEIDIDRSIKIDCLISLWVFLIKNDKERQLEKFLFSDRPISDLIVAELNDLLKKSALQLRTVQSIVSFLAPLKLEIAEAISDSLNTLDRREEMKQGLIISYLAHNDIDSIDFQSIIDVYNKITDRDKKELILEAIISKIAKEEDTTDKILLFIQKLLNDFLNIRKISIRCFVITRLITISGKANSTEIINPKTLEPILKKSWENIDEQCEKIRIGFLISKDITPYSKSLAEEYLNWAARLKDETPFSVRSISIAYLLTVDLSIKAFKGLMNHTTDLSIYLGKLELMIDKIDSIGEKIEAWRKIALVLYSKSKRESFEQVMQKNAIPLLDKLAQDNGEVYQNCIISMTPAVFLFSTVRFDNLLLCLDSMAKEIAIESTCEFILTRIIPGEPSDSKFVSNLLRFEDYENIIWLLEKITYDQTITEIIEKVVKALKNSHSQQLSQSQKRFLKTKLETIVETKLPNNITGINHKGYKIVSKSHLALLEEKPKDTQKILEVLIKEAQLIDNLSDRSFVFYFLSRAMKEINRELSLDIALNGFKLAIQIPSIYEMQERLSSLWELLYSLNKNTMREKLTEVFKLITSSGEGEYSNYRRIIDAAQDIDEDFANNLIMILDTDPARTEFKQQLADRIYENSLTLSAKKDLREVNRLSDKQFNSFIEDRLGELNSGAYGTRDIEHINGVLDRISKLSFLDAIHAIDFYIQFVAEKYAQHPQYYEFSNSNFKSLYENSILISTLSANSAPKMSALLKYPNPSSGELSSPLIRSGDYSSAQKYISDFAERYVQRELFILDPYFSKNDLPWIKLILEKKPKVSIRILTSKLESQNLKPSITQEYIDHWSSLTREMPLDVEVSIISESNSNKCPFHDRWWICDNGTKGFTINSVNSIGNRDSQIVELSQTALDSAMMLIYDYIQVKKKNISGYSRLEYFTFSIE